ncbi:hypothetical protein BsWGS_07359 [Bradybaena similaris]
MFARSLVLASLLPLVTPYEHYQKRIPNGKIVPFSCKPGQYWPGVGHFIDEGTGPRNSFGFDFEAAGKRWTKELCLKDSDHDGYHNGFELGDPNCIWDGKNAPETSEGLTHPGICDPSDSKKCTDMHIISNKYQTQGEWMADVCKSDGLECPALEDKDILNVTARLPPFTRVPAKKTSYICATFNIYKLGVPRDKDFHIVAVTPVIDNKQVVHHMALFGCKGYMEEKYDPYMCQIVPNPSCQEFLHVWTVGLDGECYHPASGVRIGKTGVQFLVVQYHWTNGEERTDLTDSSGLMLHFTPNLKPYDASVFLVGPTFFEIPPKQKHAVVKSNCASGCTKNLIKSSINITSAWNHMHLMGLDMFIEVLRNGVHIAYITFDKIYSYDSPQVFTYKQPLEIFPGDTIITQCGFTTMDQEEDTPWGDGTYDEMCFGFISYYPRQNLSQPMCLEILGMSTCQGNSLEGCSSLREFIKGIGSTRAFREIGYACRDPSKCNQECARTVLRHMKREPCMRGNIWRYIQDELAKSKGPGYEFLRRIAPCKSQAETALKGDPDMKRQN